MSRDSGTKRCNLLLQFLSMDRIGATVFCLPSPSPPPPPPRSSSSSGLRFLSVSPPSLFVPPSPALFVSLSFSLPFASGSLSLPPRRAFSGPPPLKTKEGRREKEKCFYDGFFNSSLGNGGSLSVSPSSATARQLKKR